MIEQSKIQNRNWLAFSTLVVTIVLCASGIEAQQGPKLPRIGWLSVGASSNEFPQKQVLDGLREIGWVEGKTLVIEYRHAAGSAEKLAKFAADLVRLNVNVIVTFSAGVAVAKKATGTIPIEMQTRTLFGRDS